MNRNTSKILTELEVQILERSRDVDSDGEAIAFFLELGVWATKIASDIMNEMLEAAKELKRERDNI